VRPDLFNRCSIKLGGIFNDTWLVLGPYFIDDSYIDFICSGTFKQSFAFLVKSVLDICRDQVDDCGESGFGLRRVGCAVYREAPGWFCRLEPVTKIFQMVWKPGIRDSCLLKLWNDEDGEMIKGERQSKYVYRCQ